MRGNDELGNDLTIGPGVTIDTATLSTWSMRSCSDMSAPEALCFHSRDSGRIINKGTIKWNTGQIFANDPGGEIEDNSGNIAYNYGTVDRNTQAVWVNGGTVKDNDSHVFDNQNGGTVTNNGERAVVYANSGSVTRNKGKIGITYGGTVTTNEGTICDSPQACGLL